MPAPVRAPPTDDGKPDKIAAAYCRAIMEGPDRTEWVGAAKIEPENIGELDAVF